MKSNIVFCIVIRNFGFRLYNIFDTKDGKMILVNGCSFVRITVPFNIGSRGTIQIKSIMTRRVFTFIKEIGTIQPALQ